MRKVTGRHIFDHLESMVETDCWIGADRKVYGQPRGWRSQGSEVSGFYVHPATGLLCFRPEQSVRERKRQRLMQQEIDQLRIDDPHSFKLIDGDWYFVTYEMVEIARYAPARTAWDVVERRQVQLAWGRNRVAVHKRQCDRDQVRKIHEQIAECKKKVRRM